jgi:1-acyl-sn-glycerol-3-phosphate acyltransferase
MTDEQQVTSPFAGDLRRQGLVIKHRVVVAQVRELRPQALVLVNAGVPLVPIGLKGTREILPYGSGDIRSGVVTMRIGDPIPTDHATLRDRVHLTETLRHQIVTLLEEQPIDA